MKFVLATVYFCLTNGVCESHNIRIENCKNEVHKAQMYSETEKIWQNGTVGIKCRR